MENNKNNKKYPLELNTMPGFAGSSAYYLRYEDPHNNECLVSKEANEYWRNVDLYVGGTEHATGHLIYSRFWNKFLFDFGIVRDDEPFKKLINQGMIQGRSNYMYKIILDTETRELLYPIYVSKNKYLKLKYDVNLLKFDDNKIAFIIQYIKDVFNNEIENIIPKQKIIGYRLQGMRVPISFVKNDILDEEKFKNWLPAFDANAVFIKENGKYICGYEIEKMSKSYFNVENPDDVVEKYGADTLRLYEMFLGPIEQSKPWDTHGIDGVSRFLRKLWNLFFQGDVFTVSDVQPDAEELKSLHKLIKKVGWDIENFSFNTSVAAFMICVNELTALKCNKRAILSDLVIVLSPFAPFITEELWQRLGNPATVFDACFPDYNEEYLKEDTVKYTITFNGKARFSLDFAAGTSSSEVEQTVLVNENSLKWMEGKTPKKVIIVPNKIVNIVF